MRSIDIDDAVLEASRIHREKMERALEKIRSEQKGEAFYGIAYVAGREVIVSVPVKEQADA